MLKLKIAFFGAPDFAAHILQKIIEDTNLPLTLQFIVTQPDRPVGRKQILTPTPVKLMAQKHNIPVFEKLQVTSYKLQEIDLALLYAYGKIIPSNILTIPRWGFWNIHPSLLPLYRGPSPITYPLLLGEEKTGVSLIQMDEQLDHGPIIDQEEYMLRPTDTQDIVKIRLSDIGYKLFNKNVQLLNNGLLQKKKQNHSEATYTRLLTKQDGFLPFPLVQKILKGENLNINEIPPIIQEYCIKYSAPASFKFQVSSFNLYRALSPWPGIWTLLRPAIGETSEGQALPEKRLKITGMELKDGKPLITHVQLEGKKEVDISTFQTAYKVF